MCSICIFIFESPVTHTDAFSLLFFMSYAQTKITFDSVNKQFGPHSYSLRRYIS